MKTHSNESQAVPEYAPELQALLYEYALQLADTSLILGHRLSEWCGHGPILEQDLAMANISLDLLGEARSFYQYAAELEGRNRTEDDLAYLRDAVEYKNPLLVEQPNGDFADTILRQFLFDVFHFYFLQQLQASPDARFAAIAAKSFKEASYHIKWSSEWVIRLGDGTEESKRRIEKAIQNLWRYSGELYTKNETEQQLSAAGFLPDYALIQQQWETYVAKIFKEATLLVPQNEFMQKGGKTGKHTEHLGYILTELQYVQRAYPGLEW